MLLHYGHDVEAVNDRGGTNLANGFSCSDFFRWDAVLWLLERSSAPEAAAETRTTLPSAMAN